jgi:acetyl-CoA synthetase
MRDYQVAYREFSLEKLERRFCEAASRTGSTPASNAATVGRTKLDEVARCPPVLLVDQGPNSKFAALLAAQPVAFAPVMLRGDDPFVIDYTSGTTGNPKAVRYSLRILLAAAV